MRKPLLERVCALTAPNAVALGEIGANRAFLGQIDEARAVAAELEEGFAGGSHASAYAIANVYAGLGEATLSAESSTRAYELRHRASDRERFFISAEYDRQVTGDRVIVRGHATARFGEADFRQLVHQGILWATHRLN